MRTVQVEGWKMSGVRLGVINKAWGKFLRFLRQDELHRKLEFPCRQNREIHYKLVQCLRLKEALHTLGRSNDGYLTRYLSDTTLIFRWDSKMIFQYISNKMQRYTVYLYLETALLVSGGISTHHQEHTQLHLQHLVLVKPLLLPAAIVEELELVCVCSWKCIDILSKQINTRPTAHSNQFQFFHDSGR